MSRNRFIVLSLLVDAVLVNAGFVLAFLIRFGGRLPAFNFHAYLILAPILTVLYLGGAWVYGLYDPERADTGWAVAKAAAAAVSVGTLLTAAVAFFGSSRTASFARSTILIAWAVELLLLTWWRLGLLRFARLTWPEQRVVIVGTDHASVDLAHKMAERSRWGWTVVGLVDTTTDPRRSLPAVVDGFPVLGGAHDVAGAVERSRANRVVVVSPVAVRELIESLVVADRMKLRIDVVPEFYEVFIGTFDAIVGDVPLMEVTHTAVPRYYAALKRVMDMSVAVVALLVALPVLCLAAVAILACDGRPLLYSQERLGKNREVFRLRKLRTMIRDAEAETGPVLAGENDPRITAVGRFLRRFRIDEIPQLVNIIRGEMSFVGPRPERPSFVEKYLVEIPGYRERFIIKPGLTGLAQVSGGYTTTPERKLKYDLIYVYHQTLAMDIQIVTETLRVVLTGRGAR